MILGMFSRSVKGNDLLRQREFTAGTGGNTVALRYRAVTFVQAPSVGLLVDTGTQKSESTLKESLTQQYWNRRLHGCRLTRTFYLADQGIFVSNAIGSFDEAFARAGWKTALPPTRDSAHASVTIALP